MKTFLSLLFIMQLTGVAVPPRLHPVPTQHPFEDAQRVELITYTHHRKSWWRDYEVREKGLLADGKPNIPAERIQRRLRLTDEQRQRIQEVLYSETLCEKEKYAMCYMPRHLLALYDGRDSAYAYIEFCLQCANGQWSEGVKAPVLCPKKMARIGVLFRIFLEREKIDDKN